MKAASVIAIFLFCFLPSKAQITQPVITFNTVEQMMAYSGSYTQAFVIDSLRGGTFQKLKAGTAPLGSNVTADSGVIFPAYYSGYYWVRQFQTSQGINIRWFGALGNGFSSYKEDSAALTRAVKYNNSRDGGAIYIPKAPSYYGFNGDGLVLSSNTTIYGDGQGASEIRHVNPSDALYFRGVIFYTTTYNQNAVNVDGDSLGIWNNPKYDIFDASFGQNYVRLKNIGDATNLYDGKIIYLGARIWYKGGTAKHKRNIQAESLDEVTGIRDDTVFLKYSLTTDLNGDDTSSAQIIDVNSGQSQCIQLGIPNYMTKNMSFHDLTLSQADSNLIDHTTYSFSNAPNNVIKNGGTLGSSFYNLTLYGSGSFGGNYYNRCSIHDITIVGTKKVVDWGAASANNRMYNFNWIYKPNLVDSFQEVAMFYFDDGSHHNEVFGFNISGDWAGNNILQYNTYAHDNYVHDFSMEMPSYRGTDNAAIQTTDDAASVYIYNNRVENGYILVDSIQSWIRFKGEDIALADRQVYFRNLVFIGKLVDDTAIHIRNMDGVYIDNIKTLSGKAVFQAMEHSNVERLQLSDSLIILNGTTGTTYGFNTASASNLSLQSIPTAEFNCIGGQCGGGTIPVYANNAAALSGGLKAGDRYRNGDAVYIVH